MNKRLRFSIILPVLLLAFLAVRAYVCLDLLRAGHSLRYYCAFAGGLVLIALIYWRLRKKEMATRAKADDEAQYGPYPQDMGKK